ncbi:MAG: hypothetical protein JO188_10065 [Hyphomicrobiales bacterium]|nr:hypothetical protein [Hyphomicrobiales bacterium]
MTASSKAPAEDAAKNPARNVAGRECVRRAGEAAVERSECEAAVFMECVLLFEAAPSISIGALAPNPN